MEKKYYYNGNSNIGIIYIEMGETYSNCIYDFKTDKLKSYLCTEKNEVVEKWKLKEITKENYFWYLKHFLNKTYKGTFEEINLKLF
jgi:hypothetical protein